MLTRRLLIGLSASLLLIAGGFSNLQQSTGVSMTRAANDFLSSLSDEQRTTAQMEYDAAERTDWHFIPKDYRKGLQIKDMNKAQREAAHGLLRSCLSEVGYDKAVKIMALEALLQELEKNRSGGPVRDPERYYFTLFGPPSEKGKWGLSVEGHHLSLNFVVQDGQVVSSTPTFYAANPAIVKSEVEGGLPAGTRVLAKEEELAFELVNALSEQQRQKAVIADKAPSEIRAAGEPQPPQEEPVGLPFSQLNDGQREQLKQLVRAYLENVPEDVRQDRVDAIYEAGPENVHFAWAGATKPGVGHYYRVQGPTFLIEFVNTQPDAAGNPANHIHCVWRDMRGDFALKAR